MSFMFLIYLVLGLGAFALIWWGVSSLTLPQPVKVIALVLIGLIGIAFLWQQAGHALH